MGRVSQHLSRYRRSKWWAAATAVVVAVGVAAYLVSASGSPPPRRSAHGHASKPATAAQQTSTFAGPDGIESTAIISENDLPGTTGWQISGSSSGTIEGFADTTYAADGDQVHLYVSTDAPSFTVDAYRMGWYHGAGARLVWISAPAPGKAQPQCPLTAGVNMVSCDNWTPSLTVPITASFVPGDYLLKLVGSGGQQSYVLLTVWNPDSHATYLVMARSLTEEGWNTFGGYSYYQGQGACAPTYPVCNRARVVSFDRPYDYGDGAADFLPNEYPLVFFAEEHGLDVSYVTDITVDEHPDIVSDHKALVSLGHDELWTTPERQAAETAEQHGVNMFFGSVAVLRHARLQPSPLGADREEVDYRDSAEDPVNGNGNPLDVTGNTFSSPPTNWPESGFTGESYIGYLENSHTVPLVVTDAQAWIYQGTGLTDGSQVPGAVGGDFDHVDPTEPMPQDVQVMAHSPIPLTLAYSGHQSWGGVTYSDMTYYTDPSSKAGVFDSGVTTWISDLAPCASTTQPCPASAVQQMTGNVLKLFGQGPAGGYQPSVANWQSITPPGS